MKKIVSLMLVAVLMLGLVGCGGGEPAIELQDDYTVQTVVEDVMEAYPLTMPGEIDATVLNDIFYIDETMYDEFYGQMSIMMPGTDVVVLVKAKEGMTESVVESLEKYMEDVMMSAYLPNDIAKIEAAEVITNGDFVFLAMVLDQTDAENPTAGIEGSNEIFMESFK